MQNSSIYKDIEINLENISDLIDSMQQKEPTQDDIRSFYILLYQLFYYLAVLNPTRYLSKDQSYYLKNQFGGNCLITKTKGNVKEVQLIYKLAVFLKMLDPIALSTLLKVV